MSKTPQHIMVTQDHHLQRLDNFLFAHLKNVPKSLLYRLLRKGKISMNQKRCQPSDRVRTKDTIKLPILQMQSSKTSSMTVPLNLKKQLLKAILFEDKNLLIIDKPHGLAVHGGSGIQQGAIEALRQLYPQENYLALAHRLDRETSGCLIFAKKPMILKALHTLFRTGKIKKTYLMLVKAKWPITLTQINVPLKKNHLKSGERVVIVHPEGKSTFTQCHVEKHFQHTSLVKVILHTGRTHQIRVHAQHVKHPIIGDDKYGDSTFNRKIFMEQSQRLFLHAYDLEFTLPTLGRIKVKAPLPKELNQLLMQQKDNTIHTEGGT